LKKEKAPSGSLGALALRGVGGGRGLAARDAVCIDLTIAFSDPIVYYFWGSFLSFFPQAPARAQPD
jgi:hypothetical protein